MIKIKNKIDKRITGLIIILFIGLVVFLMNLTSASLWYDEGVEYFFSKYMTGTVPIQAGTTNMYERIISTFQPPLYNVLMYIWLLVFDDIFTFRLAGVLVTLIGAVAIYLIIDKISNYLWAIAGTLLYIFSGSVSYYALECGEYNLLFCCLAWTSYFYINALIDEKNQIKYCVLFFLFACLSVYSQYGAVFVIVPMYFSLFAHFIKRKKVKTYFIVFTAIVLLVAAIPLVLFFFIPQFTNQGTDKVSHYPYFAHGNIFVDFIQSIKIQLAFNLFNKSAASGVTRILLWLFAVLFVSGFICVLVFNRKRTLICLYSISLISWLLYYIAVACSFYGHTSWMDTIGTENIGNRYGMIFVPLWVITITYGLHEFYILICSSKTKSFTFAYRAVHIGLIAVLLIGILLFSTVGTYTLYKGYDKGNAKEIAQVWFEQDNNALTVMENRSSPPILYYVFHDIRSDDEIYNRIIAKEKWVDEDDDTVIDNMLKSDRVLDNDAFYFITESDIYDSRYKSLIRVLNSYNYSAEMLYCPESEDSSIYRMYRFEKQLKHR